MSICSISGKEFQMSEFEKSLRKKLWVQDRTKLAKYIFQELWAFWQHFAIHKRKCDKTWKWIISVFDEHCPYPVWEKWEWIQGANPPSREFDFNKWFFEQAWDLFQKCPIPHNIWTWCENCEYTDDWWYSKNCYLCHSWLECEDLAYCYRIIRSKNCQFCVFSFDCELCTDVINSRQCFNVNYALNCNDCKNSNFLFDCRNCEDCLYCWNLRNKKYCIANKQFTKDEYLKEKEKFDLSSRKNYELAKQKFHNLIKTQAWWKNVQNDNCENCIWDSLENDKNCENCFLFQNSEDCVNCIRWYLNKFNVDTLSNLKTEFVYYSCLAQDWCYNLKFCYNVINTKNSEYCAHMLNCKDCFACCGLVWKSYCILNKQYSKEEYEKLVWKIKEYIQKTWEYWKFFPWYFAANSYDESLSWYHFPLSIEEQKKQWFRIRISEERRNEWYLSVENVPDNSQNVSNDICKNVYWDDIAKKPFQIKDFDIVFCKKQKVPLPNSFYIRRIKENFSWMFFDWELRETKCAISWNKIQTTLPQFLDWRIISNEEYLKKIL